MLIEQKSGDFEFQVTLLVGAQVFFERPDRPLGQSVRPRMVWGRKEMSYEIRLCKLLEKGRGKWRVIVGDYDSWQAKSGTGPPK